MSPLEVSGGMCPECVLGQVIVRMDILMIPIEAKCKDCGHVFDPIQEMNQWND